MPYLLLLILSATLFACGAPANESDDPQSVETTDQSVEPVASGELATTDGEVLASPNTEQGDPEAEEVVVIETSAPDRNARLDDVTPSEPSVQPVEGTSPEVVRVEVPVANNSELNDESSAEASPEEMESVNEVAIATDAWGRLLVSNVNSRGGVNYQGIKASMEVLDSYLDVTSSGPPSGTLAARAYWINQYNAYTIKLILDNWPVVSIMDLHGGKAWDVKWIEIAGESLSLNQIEFEKLRPGQTDARIHFAVNCAAASCPPLYNRLFTASNLDSTLERLAKSFINNRRYNNVSSTPWQLSRIFDWYAGDFGNVLEFIEARIEGEAGSPGDAPGFLEYDWSLNKQ